VAAFLWGSHLLLLGNNCVLYDGCCLRVTGNGAFLGGRWLLEGRLLSNAGTTLAAVVGLARHMLRFAFLCRLCPVGQRACSTPAS
jgi:hypothetical protein